MDKSSLGGIALALAGISSVCISMAARSANLLQPTAALIVFGGTLGAVMVQFPFPVVKQAAFQLKEVFFGVDDKSAQLVTDLLRYAGMARRGGLMSLDSELESIKNPFLRKALTMAVDGTHAADLRQRMELEMDKEADREELIPKVFEAAGGFAPTIGILGAVIGLIQVMQRIENINEVGKGIAVAFVATIYGVGSANILFLPWAGRMKILMRKRQVVRELILDGVLSLVDKTNPRIIEAKLAVYLGKATAPEQRKRVSA